MTQLSVRMVDLEVLRTIVPFSPVKQGKHEVIYGGREHNRRIRLGQVEDEFDFGHAEFEDITRQVQVIPSMSLVLRRTMNLGSVSRKVTWGARCVTSIIQRHSPERRGPGPNPQGLSEADRREMQRSGHAERRHRYQEMRL